MACCLGILLLAIFSSSLFAFDIDNDEIMLNTTSLMLEYVSTLYNESDTFDSIVLKIQSAFCPGQALCSGDDYTNSNTNDTANYRNMGDLFQSVNYTAMNRLLARSGICCATCSCEESCYEDGNCCPAKQIFQNRTIPMNLTNDCIAANVQSYVNKHSNILANSFMMITKCFADKSNESLVKSCETPDLYNIQECLPVTSVSSGRTYWNKYCSQCNHDADTTLVWDIEFATSAVLYYFSSGAIDSIFPQTFKDLYRLFARTGRLYYIQPNDMAKPCFQRGAVQRCNRIDDIVREYVRPEIIFQGCNHFLSPVLQRSNTFGNALCFLFSPIAAFSDQTLGECKIKQIKSESSFSGILNYEESRGDVIEPENHLGIPATSLCSCDNVYDTYRNACRPLYCAPGDVYIGCKCKAIALNVTGMPVFVKLKVIPNPAEALPTKTSALRKLRNDIKTAFQTSYEQLNVYVVATFKSTDDTAPYFLQVLEVRTAFGYDTKEVLKSIIDSFDRHVLFETESGGTKFQVLPTNEIKLIKKAGHSLKAMDIINRKVLVLTYQAYRKWGQIMEASILLYCQQVQLDKDEFSEDNGTVSLTVNPELYIGLNYIYLPFRKEIRICVDHYLNQPGAASPNLAVKRSVQNVFAILLSWFVCTSSWRIL